MDENYWKLSKKEASMCGSSSKSHIPRSFSTKMSNSSSSNSPLLMRSCSTRASTSCSSKSSSLLPRSASQKSSNITRKCTNLAKEHKARFYIMKRCITMLVCWHKHSDSRS
ncbi:uncharacterized protein LOC116211074 [Punica granatum]|uniref:Uncharacterized protein LOC116211074 n=1 Tax=Punica granatum TaxID=22663 RepID=A0A6P8E055_PUNGR|nr:uncharacterized protein LOC116211074 [Punica granatum]